MSMNTISTNLIAIGGYAASGKTTLASLLKDYLPNSIVIHTDDFYHPTHKRTYGDFEAVNYDLPRLLEQVILPFVEKRPIRYQRYDWVEDKLAEWIEITQCETLILEGVRALDVSIRPYIDYAIWVEAPYELRLKRGMERDGEHMRSLWVNEWMPSEEYYVASQHPEKYAHVCISGEAPFILEEILWQKEL
ncbi:MAG: AAA family ATPase [Candidatus Izemoplasmatales bacterium]|nr:AAA family ATPase [Candidatus Izemoplasmatales bacterium]